MSLEEIAKGDFVARFAPVGSHFIKVSGHFTIRGDSHFSQFCSQEIETGFHALGTDCKIYVFARLDRN